MTTKAQAVTLITLGATLVIAPAQTTQPSATASAPPVPAPSAAEQMIKDMKNPVSWLSWGGDFRIRNEYFDNALTLTPQQAPDTKHPASGTNPTGALHEQDYFRIRGRVWASIKPFEDLSFNARLANESREWMKPAGYTLPFGGHSGLDLRDGIFDNLNVQWRNILNQPVTATVGRQDIFLGDGWLVGDGTPFDGSWTYYLDSARVTIDLKDQHTTVDVIGIMQDGRDNGWLETVNANQYLFETEQNEKGAILWVANKSLPKANLDGYFIYKQDDALNGIAAKYHADNANIYTLGGRVSGLLNAHWKYSAEGAYQFGHKQDPSIADASTAANASAATDFRALSAFGVNSKLTYLFKDRLNNQVNFSYEFLSGDDPATHNDEMFDNLWGRWPRWSEIGLYSFAAETRIGNEANMHRIGPGWSFTPARNLDFSAAYYILLAQQDVATRGLTSLFAGNSNLPDHGIFRGHFASAILKYKFSQHMSGHLWSEFEFPGDYYANKTMWSFLRAEVMFTF
jgi:hypothetical protein